MFKQRSNINSICLDKNVCISGKKARKSKLTRWFAESVMVVIWVVKDRLVSKVMPRSFTEVTSRRKKH